MNHIELFSGCGGLCLGLSEAGFELLMANELSPMAAETFAYNLLQENLLDHGADAKHSLWLSSKYSRIEFSRRLRENPQEYPENYENCDLDATGENLNGSLVVGSIVELNEWLSKHPAALEKLQKGFGQGGVDLISGGPPCQSFSLAGLREKNNAKNRLPWEFVRFAQLVSPKVILLENVTGILRPFVESGEKYHAWFEIAKAFAQIGYVPLPLHINAKFAGVAQNRPRFILIGVRKDISEVLDSNLNDVEETLFANAREFYKKVCDGVAVSVHELKVWDLNSGNEAVFDAFAQSFLAPLVSHRSDVVSVQKAIGDLSTEKKTRMSKFVLEINKRFGKHLPPADMSHYEIRGNEDRVRRRFRIYQVQAAMTNKMAAKEISSFLAGRIETLSDVAWNEIRKFKFLTLDNKMALFRDKEEFEKYLSLHLTKKQTQKALVADQPAPAALSIPDDFCHYADLRTLTAREMARIQTFPDNFVFRSKRTTGGQSRRFEVPVFTQIGNAVPVQLGYALGECIVTLLNKAKSRA